MSQAVCQERPQTVHRSVNIDGLDIFYREAGSAAAPTILLLHGFPTSSHMFRNLMPRLADRFLPGRSRLSRIRSQLDARSGRV